MKKDWQKPVLFYVVDLVSQSWNQLYSWVFEASEAIVGARSIKNAYAIA
jgi:hypothetical protein